MSQKRGRERSIDVVELFNDVDVSAEIAEDVRDRSSITHGAATVAQADNAQVPGACVASSNALDRLRACGMPLFTPAEQARWDRENPTVKASVVLTVEATTKEFDALETARRALSQAVGRFQRQKRAAMEALPFDTVNIRFSDTLIRTVRLILLAKRICIPSIDLVRSDESPSLYLGGVVGERAKSNVWQWKVGRSPVPNPAAWCLIDLYRWEIALYNLLSGSRGLLFPVGKDGEALIRYIVNKQSGIIRGLVTRPDDRVDIEVIRQQVTLSPGIHLTSEFVGLFLMQPHHLYLDDPGTTAQSFSVSHDDLPTVFDLNVYDDLVIEFSTGMG